MPVTVPPSLLIVLQVLRPCFTAPSLVTLAALVTGALSGAGRRTVTGMWQAAGLAGSVHWSRAHRFLSRAVWDLDQVGLALARAVVARLVPDAGAVTGRWTTRPFTATARRCTARGTSTTARPRDATASAAATAL